MARPEQSSILVSAFTAVLPSPLLTLFGALPTVVLVYRALPLSLGLPGKRWMSSVLQKGRARGAFSRNACSSAMPREERLLYNSHADGLILITK